MSFKINKMIFILILIIGVFVLFKPSEVSAAIDINSDEFIVHNIGIEGMNDHWYGLYTGNEIMPIVTVKYRPKVGNKFSENITILKEGQDFTVSYFNNIDVGTGKVRIRGINNYCGIKEYTFEIKQREIYRDTDIQYYSVYYTGERIEPRIIMTNKINNRMLVQGIDFDVQLIDDDNINAGFVDIKIVGKGNFYDEFNYSFLIQQIDIEKVDIKIVSEEYLYTGEPIRPNIIATYNGKTLVEGKDYNMVDSPLHNYNITDIGDKTIPLNLMGNFNGSAQINYKIKSAPISSATVKIGDKGIVPYSKTGSVREFGEAIKPQVTVTYNGKTLVEGKDYKLTYSNNDRVGTATVTIEGINNFEGITKEEYKITPIHIMEAEVSAYYTHAGKVDFKLKHKDISLIEGIDYEIKSCQILESKIATVCATIAGKGNMGGIVEDYYSIEKINLKDASLKVENDSYTYTGDKIEPKFDVLISEQKEIGGEYSESEVEKIYPNAQIESITYDTIGKQVYTKIKLNYTLVEEKDYEYIYENNEKVGKGEILVAATVSGYFVGGQKMEFEITERSTKDVEINLNETEHTFSGKEIRPSVTATYNEKTLIEGQDYEVTYSDNINVGKGRVSITGKGNFKDSVEKTFTINQCRIRGAQISLSSEIEHIFSGKEIRPNVTATHKGETLIEGQDYEVSYLDNINAGRATVVITGKGNYKETAGRSFIIGKRSINDVEVSEVVAMYTGEKLEPEFEVKYDEKVLVEGEDYDIIYPDNINAGTGTIILRGMGNFDGVTDIPFKISERPIENAKISLDKEEYDFSGRENKPSVTAIFKGKTLIKGRDYEVLYSDNINAGTGKVLINGKGNFKESIEKTFTITGKSMSEVKATVIGRVVYTGEKLEPEFKVLYNGEELVKGRDFEISYSDNINVGKGKAILTGIGNFNGSKDVTFQISKRQMSGATISLNDTDFSYTGNCAVKAVSSGISYKYTGETITPKVTVTYKENTLVEGKDYTVSYSNNIKVGTGTITLKGIGNFGGTGKVTFTIE